MKPDRQMTESKNGDVPFFSFSSRERSIDDRIDATDEYFGDYFSIDCPKENVDVFEYRSNGWLSDQLMFGRMKIGNCTIHKSKQLNWDVVGLRVVQEGEIRGVVAGSPFLARPGDVLLFDFSKSSALEHRQAHQIAVTLPKDKLGYVSGVHDPIIRIEGSTAQARFVISYLDYLFRSIVGWNTEQARVASEGLCGLLASVLGPGRGAVGNTRVDQNARLQSIKQYIHANLTSPSLRTETICEHFGVSRATLFRLFGDEGGLEKYFQMRRLEQAYVDLASTSATKGEIGRVAKKYRFYDVAHFSKAFLGKFDFRPSEILGIGNREAGHQSARATEDSTETSFGALVSRLQLVP